jgi:Tfp pilus assembly protein PilX
MDLPNMPPPKFTAPQRSAGFSLVTAVVVVLMVSIVGFTAMTVSRSQLLAAGSAQFQITALHEADRSVATAESWLNDGNNARNAAFTTYTTGTGLFPRNYMADNSLDPLIWTWSDSNSVPVNSGAGRYAIEQVAVNLVPFGESRRDLIDDEGKTDCKAVNLYRISARGTNGTGASRTLQTVFGVPGC